MMMGHLKNLLDYAHHENKSETPDKTIMLEHIRQSMDKYVRDNPSSDETKTNEIIMGQVNDWVRLASTDSEFNDQELPLKFIGLIMKEYVIDNPSESEQKSNQTNIGRIDDVLSGNLWEWQTIRRVKP